MTLQRVAQLAGVSTSTGSRVLNRRSNVAADTAAAVNKIMRELLPDLRPPRFRASADDPGVARISRNAALAFLVFGTSGSHPAPAFDRLLRGVSGAASQRSLELIFSFISDPTDAAALPRNLDDRRIGGLLLHGERPSAAVQARLQRLPTVWLMGNRQRPLWGDQVMPDNVTIGEMAAQYLLRRGHRRMAYLCSGTDAWWMPMRSLSFTSAAADAGAHAIVLKATEDRSGDLWRGDGLMAAARQLVEQLAAISPAPTGVFIAEDRLLPAIDAMLRSREFGGVLQARRLEIISCNNERPYLAAAHDQNKSESGGGDGAVTIDIRAESIGQRGVDQLVWRMHDRAAASTVNAGSAAPDRRVRIMVEPLLVDRSVRPHSSPAALNDLSVGLEDWCRRDVEPQLSQRKREDSPSLSSSPSLVPAAATPQVSTP